jgi:hypothetical protein
MKGRWFLWIPMILGIIFFIERKFYYNCVTNKDVTLFIIINTIVVCIISLLIELKNLRYDLFDNYEWNKSDFKYKPLCMFSILYWIVTIVININRFLDKHLTI